MADRLEGRVALITGGASGIGLAIAERFLAEGMKVVLADVEKEALDRQVARLESQGGEVLGVVCDVRDPDAVSDLAASTLSAFGAVGIGLTWLTDRLERAPSFWLLAVLALIVLERLFVGTLEVLSHAVLGRIGWWAIGGGNLSAVVVMGAWLWRTHPRLREELVEKPVHTKV